MLIPSWRLANVVFTNFHAIAATQLKIKTFEVCFSDAGACRKVEQPLTASTERVLLKTLNRDTHIYDVYNWVLPL